MLEQKYSTRFKKDLKKYQHKKDVIEELGKVLKALLTKSKLPEKYKIMLLQVITPISENVILSQIFY